MVFGLVNVFSLSVVVVERNVGAPDEERGVWRRPGRQRGASARAHERRSGDVGQLVVVAEVDVVQ